MKKLALAAILATCGIVNATAADLSVKAPPPAPIPAISWTGIYVGINGGGAFSNIDFFSPASPTNVALGCALINLCAVDFGNHHASGGFFGGQAGINYQAGIWVVGAEVEAAWANIAGGAITQNAFLAASAKTTGNSKVDALYDATARVGVAAGPALFFVKGGAAWAEASFFTVSQGLLGTSTLAASETRMGWVVGTGIEYAFRGAWSAKLEYDYMDFGRQRLTLTGNGGGPFDFDIRENIHLVKAGLNYRFDWGGPLVARY